MKQINKILIVFFVFSFLTIYGGWRFIHSRKFSDEASIKVSNILTKKFGAKLSFIGVGFDMFPPATVFKNVYIEKEDPRLVDIDLSIEELRVSFTYTSFFSSNLEIDDLELKNGTVKIITHKTDRPDINWRELNFEKIFNEYSQILAQSPVHLNLAKLENIKAQVDDSSFFVNSLSLAPHHKNVLFKTSASKINIDPKLKGFPVVKLEKCSALVEFTKNQWKIESIQLENDQNKVEMNAVLHNQKKLIESKANIDFGLNLETALKLYPKLPDELKTVKGKIEGTAIVSGNVFDPEIDLNIDLNKLQSEWIPLENAKIQIKKKKGFLVLEKLKATNQKEQYELLSPQTFYDIKKNMLLHGRLSFYLKDAFTNTFLYTIKNSLEAFKGYVTGKVDVVWNGEKVSFEIKDKAYLKDFKLLSPSKKSILRNAGFSIVNTVLTLDKNFTLEINANVLMANTALKATGEITNKDLNISIQDSKIDMSAFGPISDLPITGSGPANAEIYGPFNDVKFDFNVDWDKFSVVDLNLGKVKSEFSLSLKDFKIDIHHLEGIYNLSNFNAKGSLDFGKKEGMDLNIDFKNSNFQDAHKMYALIFKNMKLPIEPEFNFTANYHVQGGYGLDTLVINGDVKGTDVNVLNEEAESLAFHFNLQNSLLNFKDIKIKKARGEINGDVSINLVNNYIELEGGAQGLRLSDLNIYRKFKLDYDGDLNIDFDGNGTVDNFSSRFKTRVSNTFIDNVPASPSNAIFYIGPEEIVVNASLLSGKIKFDSQVNLKTRLVSVTSKADTADLREVLGFIAGHNMTDKAIQGRVKAQLNTEFNLDSLVVKKFFLDISNFNLKKGDINVMIDKRYSSVAIDNGNVKKWDLRFVDGNDFFISKAKNVTNGAIVFDQSFSLKTSFLEFLSNSVDKAVGVMKGSSQFMVDKKVTITNLEIKGEKNSLKIKNLPGAITGLEFSLAKRGEIFEIYKLHGKYGEGDFNATGTLFFDDLYPEINIDYTVERSTIPLFKRSSLLVSSAGTIIGKGLPYKLNGKVTLLHGEFEDDPSDFSKENKVTLDAFKKYLPQKNKADKKGYLDLNVAFDTANPIVVKNNLAEIYAKGSGQLSGDVLSPEINGRAEILPNVSKFKFKGHDFVLSQGYVEIRDHTKTRVSDLKFIGLAKINDYDVKLDISGSIENTVIALSSEPVLAQEDLVALLTLGVTSDMSKNLEASERKSVTTVGIGTLLVDQLKINEDLNSSLGLNLSVLPEFKEDETSLVSGKSAVSDSGTSRLRSGTKIKIRKPISKQVELSLSTTVGGSIEQTQEMNINYNINKNFSLEGVYEVKPAEEVNTSAPNSVGADLKFRRSF